MNRNINIDLCRCVAIICVLLGHSIQGGSGSNYFSNTMFFDNKLFLLIYSFHMPLFIIISGYLFYFSVLKYSGQKLLINKFKTLIVPIIFWSFIPIIISVINQVKGNDGISFCYNYYSIFVNNLGFLGAIFGCMVVVLIGNKIFKDNLIYYFLLFLICFVTPDGLFHNDSLGLYKYTYFFFVLSYLFNKHQLISILRKCSKKVLVVIFVILILAYVILYLHFDKSILIYISGFSIIGKNIPIQLYFNFYRFVIGLVGSVLAIFVVVFLSKFANDKKWVKPFSFVGRETLGIYIVSSQIFMYVLPKVTSSLVTFNYLIVLIETIAICIACLIIIWAIRNAKKLLLGE